MPVYEFQCSDCKRRYQETTDFREQRIGSKCCNSIAVRLTQEPKGLPMTESGHLDVRELLKPAAEKGPIDGGVPFGTVPGDEDYETEIGGKKIGDEGYIGPMP